jgi:dCTP deaminase
VGIKADHWIRRMAMEQRMIDPFEPSQVRGKVISYGLSSYGYDIRLAGVFKTPASAITGGVPLDPKNVAQSAFEDVGTNVFELSAGSFVLGRTVEYFRIPSDVLTICVGKSSYARCGVLVNVTPFEPGWEGFATLCIANVGPRPVLLYAGEGIAQVVFLQGDEPCELSYAGKRGKYQDQSGIATARLG